MAIQIGQWTLEPTNVGWKTADSRFMFRRVGSDWDIRVMGIDSFSVNAKQAIDHSGAFAQQQYGSYRMPGQSLKTIAQACADITGCQSRLIRISCRYSIDGDENLLLTKRRRGWIFMHQQRRADMSEMSWETDLRIRIDTVNENGPYATRQAALTAYQREQDNDFRLRYASHID